MVVETKVHVDLQRATARPDLTSPHEQRPKQRPDHAPLNAPSHDRAGGAAAAMLAADSSNG
ncbi:MAG TPA: hypothetical protein PKU97_13685 [Kofleriaceae bacterium]|nr:hypothetical protein [Kofleriaceae bacterium]